MSSQEIGALIKSVNDMTVTVAGKMSEIDLSVSKAESKIDDFILKARSEYIRFTHYVPLPTKIVVPALGLSDQEADLYRYINESDYTPMNSDNVDCYIDLIEFSNGFNQLPIPDGMKVYLHLLVNVEGDNNVLQDTKVNILRHNTASGSYHGHESPSSPYVFISENSRNISISGRDWADNYKDRNTILIDNFDVYNGLTFTALRIINLGKNRLEVFGVGVEVRA